MFLVLSHESSHSNGKSDNQRSRSRHHSRSNSRHRSSSRRRRRRSHGKRRRRDRSHSRHSRSRSRDKGNSSTSVHHLEEVVTRLVQNSLSQAFASQVPSQSEGPSTSASIQIGEDIKSLKKGQKELTIEKKVASLSTAGAQSQYRAIATIGLKLESALEKIDEMQLSLEDPDEPMYLSLSNLRQDLLSAQEIGKDRCDLIVRADEDPHNGWRALTRYEKLIENGKSTDPEKEKMFADCLKKVAEEKKKKSKVTGTQFAQSLAPRPFRGGPGYAPGNSSYGSAQGYNYIQFAHRSVCFFFVFIYVEHAITKLKIPIFHFCSE